MHANQLIFRQAVWFFAALGVLVLWGFWSSYFSNPLQLSGAVFHVHGIAMSAWCALLISQALLIRLDHRPAHRRFGQVSYALAPVIFVTMLVLIRDTSPPDGLRYMFHFYLLGAAVLFATFYLLAIAARKTPQRHARLMICTVFPMYSAATDRGLVEIFGAESLMPLAAWLAGDLVLLGLATWEWRARTGSRIFAGAFLTMFSYHVLIFVAPLIPPWRLFADWFFGAG